jgi:hypothetical protein
VLQTQTIRIKNAVAEVIYLHYQNDYQTNLFNCFNA